ncbi:dephospho-CoA kinase [Alcaligenes endophyticus]|uniref:Dephospho-CoA kinase n=1 Tax=Alcaligenes endophyticus TaxID=1929088 RepID=A0ABT8EG43_9BURK|nr:dephospho-CoA kinase [Alcaligenes endophyticus]MCX5590083.1 dephospho-CoA kinase [Alcaligenes endophyticus]MDN4120254.1 dephospho-CoA kinase [Alcaligenes endophyticus]
MLKIGLTGGIGSGKSQVADFLQAWGAAVIDTDRIAHQLTLPGGRAIAPIADAFGADYIQADGALDRNKMRETVFNDPSARQKLESIIHPLITVVTNAQVQSAQGCYLVIVVPLLIESGRWQERVDRVCVVDCDPETQIQRVQLRSGLSASTVTQIMAVQASREQRLSAADDVILNDIHTTLDDLERRTKVMHERWLAQSSLA